MKTPTSSAAGGRRIFGRRCRGSVIARAAAGAILVLLWAGALEAQEAHLAWVEAWRHETAEPVLQAAAGDVDQDGSPDIAVLVASGIEVFAARPEGPRLLGRIPAPDGEFTSVALADYDGDGADEVWAGGTAPGFVAVYRYEGGAFHLVEKAGYAWDDVVRLVPVDLDGAGKLDVALVTRGGELYVFRWQEPGFAGEELAEFGRDVRFVAAGDFDADGREELAVARALDHVVLLDWAPGEGDGAEDGRKGALVPAWENYAWGGHAFLAAGRFGTAQGQGLSLATSRGLLYLFAWEDGQLQPLGAPQSRFIAPGRGLAVADLDLDGEDEIVVQVDAGIEAWDALPAGASVTLMVSARPVEFVYIMEGGGPVVTAGPWGFARHDRKDGRYVRILRRGLEFPLRRAAIVTADAVYLSAADWEALTGIRLRWSAASGRITGIRGFHFLVGDLDGGWIYDGRPAQLPHPPLVRDGELYLPVQFAGIVGVSVLWDPYTRTLVFDP